MGGILFFCLKYSLFILFFPATMVLIFYKNVSRTSIFLFNGFELSSLLKIGLIGVDG